MKNHTLNACFRLKQNKTSTPSQRKKNQTETRPSHEKGKKAGGMNPNVSGKGNRDVYVINNKRYVPCRFLDGTVAMIEENSNITQEGVNQANLLATEVVQNKTFLG